MLDPPINCSPRTDEPLTVTIRSLTPKEEVVIAEAEHKAEEERRQKEEQEQAKQQEKEEEQRKKKEEEQAAKARENAEWLATFDRYSQRVMMQFMESVAISNKDVSVMETDRYIIVKIPRVPTHKTAAPKAPASIDEFDGILANVPVFKGKSSVEVQHMMKDL